MGCLTGHQATSEKRGENMIEGAREGRSWERIPSELQFPALSSEGTGLLHEGNAWVSKDPQSVASLAFPEPA